MRKSLLSLIPVIASFAAYAHGAASYTYDLSESGYQYPAVADATSEVATACSTAKTWFSSNPGGTFTVLLGAGNYRFVTPSAPSNGAIAIDMSGINPGSSGGVNGQFIIKGAGDYGGTPTHLQFTEIITADGSTAPVDVIEFGGSNCNNITLTGFHVLRLITNNQGINGGIGAPDGSTRSVTQGTVEYIGSKTVSGSTVYYAQVEVPSEFPTPWDVFDDVNFPDGNGGRYTRSYAYVSGSAQIGTDNQVPWQTAAFITNPTYPNLWELDSTNKAMSQYAVGTILGIKSKHGADSGRFTNSSYITLNQIRWTDCSRVAFVGTSNYTTVTNCRTDRGDDIDGISPCLSTNEGGPQVNPNDLSTGTNVIINNNYSAGEGDDAIACFSIDNSPVPTGWNVVNNNTISDDFARGINLTTQPTTITCTGNTVTRCPTIPSPLP